jgi:hypothetical protein
LLYLQVVPTVIGAQLKEEVPASDQHTGVVVWTHMLAGQFAERGRLSKKPKLADVLTACLKCTKHPSSS